MRAHPTRGPTCCRAPRSFHRKAEPPCEFHHTADPVSSYFGALPPCCPAAYALIARARSQAGRAKRSNGEAIAAHGAQKSRTTREIQRREPPDPPIPRPPNARKSHSLTTYRVFRTTSEKHRVSCYSASLRPAVLSTEHEGALDGFRFRYEKRYGYDADAHARGRKPRRRPAIAASGSTQTPQPPADMPSAPALKAGVLPACRFSLIRRSAR